MSITCPSSPVADVPARDAPRKPRVRICLLGLGWGGLAAEVIRCANEYPKDDIEIVAVFGASAPITVAGDLQQPIVAAHWVRGPSLFGDSMWRKSTAFVGNLRSAWRILRQERPDLILAVGTAQAIPFGIVARLLGIPLWFAESLTRVETPSRTGHWMYRLGLCSRFYYYWPSLARYFRGGAWPEVRRDLRHRGELQVRRTGPGR